LSSAQPVGRHGHSGPGPQRRRERRHAGPRGSTARWRTRPPRGSMRAGYPVRSLDSGLGLVRRLLSMHGRPTWRFLTVEQCVGSRLSYGRSLAGSSSLPTARESTGAPTPSWVCALAL